MAELSPPPTPKDLLPAKALPISEQEQTANGTGIVMNLQLGHVQSEDHIWASRISVKRYQQLRGHFAHSHQQC